MTHTHIYIYTHIVIYCIMHILLYRGVFTMVQDMDGLFHAGLVHGIVTPKIVHVRREV